MYSCIAAHMYHCRNVLPQLYWLYPGPLSVGIVKKNHHFSIGCHTFHVIVIHIGSGAYPSIAATSQAIDTRPPAKPLETRLLYVGR